MTDWWRIRLLFDLASLMSLFVLLQYINQDWPPVIYPQQPSLQKSSAGLPSKREAFSNSRLSLVVRLQISYSESLFLNVGCCQRRPRPPAFILGPSSQTASRGDQLMPASREKSTNEWGIIGAKKSETIASTHFEPLELPKKRLLIFFPK